MEYAVVVYRGFCGLLLNAQDSARLSRAFASRFITAEPDGCSDFMPISFSTSTFIGSYGGSLRSGSIALATYESELPI